MPLTTRADGGGTTKSPTWADYLAVYKQQFNIQLKQMTEAQRRDFLKDLEKQAKESEATFQENLRNLKLEAQRQFRESKKQRMLGIMQSYARKTPVERARMLEAGRKWEQSELVHREKVRQRKATKAFRTSQTKWERQQRQAFKGRQANWKAKSIKSFETSIATWRALETKRFNQEMARLKQLYGFADGKGGGGSSLANYVLGKGTT